VLGEFQPRKRNSKGKKEVEGEPIKDYFPKIIDEDLFNRAAQSRLARSTRNIDGKKQPVGGRKGKGLPNLFTGIPMKCLYCGSAINRLDKNEHGGIFFVCSNAQRGMGCEKTHWNYKHFETSFLAHTDELGLEKLARSEEEMTLQDEKQKELNNLKARLSDIVDKMESLMEAATTVPMVAKKLKDWEDKRVLLAATIATKEEEFNQLTSEVKNFYSSRRGLKPLIDQLQKKEGGDDLYRLRAEVNAKLKSLVASIHLATVGASRKPTRTFSVEQQLSLATSVEPDSGRFFQVEFTTGAYQVIFPTKDPFKTDNDAYMSGGLTFPDDDGEEV
jgi:hypothetical protein